MVAVKVASAIADPHNIPRPLELTHGRAEIGTQSDPPSTEFEWWSDTMPWSVGDDVQIWDSVPYHPATYDDPVVTYDDPSSAYDSPASGVVDGQHFGGTIVAIEATGYLGEVRTWRVTAVGYLARWGVTPVKLTGRPAETDVTRVQAIAAAAGYSIVIDGTSSLKVVAGDVDNDALSAVQEVCESSGGLVWQDRHGRVHYTTAGYRSANQQPDFAVSPSILEDLVVWDTSAEDIVNRVTITYGPSTARATTMAEDTASQAESWGLRALAVDTQCSAEVDAEQLGALIVARRAWPYWGSINALAVLDPATEVLFNAADVNTVLLLPIPRDPGPIPLDDPAPWVLEGWIETWTEGMEHTASLAASDQRRWVTTTLRTYTEVNAAGTYQHWLNQGTYLDMFIKEA